MNLWHRDLTRVCENIPIIVVGNKVDLKERKLKPKQIVFPPKKNLKYIEISVQLNFNINSIFDYLIKRMTKKRDLILLEYPKAKEPSILTQKFSPEIINFIPSQIKFIYLLLLLLIKAIGIKLPKFVLWEILKFIPLPTFSIPDKTSIDLELVNNYKNEFKEFKKRFDREEDAF